MNARLLTHLSLLALVAGLGLVLWRGPGPVPVRQSLSTQSADAIQKVRIQPRKGEAITFQRHGRTWTMRSPWSLPASTVRLGAILKLPGMRTHKHFPETDVDLPALGLSPPRVSLWLDGEVYDFGDSNPLSGQRYVRHGGQVHLLTDTVYHQLVTPAAGMLDPHPLPADRRLTRVELPGLTLRRHIDGHWQAVPDRPALDRQRLPDFIHHWQGLQARTIERIDSPVEGTNLDFFFANKTHIHFTLQTRDKGIWLIRAQPALAYHLPDDMPAQGLLSPFATTTARATQ